MKTVNTIAAAAIGLVGSASAFSLDFTSIPLGTDLGPIIVPVPGFGFVKFTEAVSNTTGLQSELTVNDTFVPNPGIEFQEGDQLGVEFISIDNPTHRVDTVFFVFTNVDAGESFTVSSTVVPDDGTRLVSFAGAGNGGGLSEVGFTTIPEPSSTLLVALSALGLVARRRR